MPPLAIAHRFYFTLQRFQLMSRSFFSVALVSFFSLASIVPAVAVPLTGSGVLPFPGATGDPARQIYAAAGLAGGPFTGTWSVPANPAWIGTFPATGAMPHTPPVGAPVAGTAMYDFSISGGYAPGALPVGTYFQFGDLDNGSNSPENFQLRAFSGTSMITTPWLDVPFASTATAFAADMPSYTFVAGVYRFDGSAVPGNPAISVFLKNNVAITGLEVMRSATTTAFVLGAPLAVPEPGCAVLALCGAAATFAAARRRGR
jgi:hypothetical protein